MNAAAKRLDVPSLRHGVGETEAAGGNLFPTDTACGDDLTFANITAVEHAGQRRLLAELGRHVGFPDSPRRPANAIAEGAGRGLGLKFIAHPRSVKYKRARQKANSYQLQAKQRAHCAGVAHRVAPEIIIEVDENIQLLRLPFP